MDLAAATTKTSGSSRRNPNAPSRTRRPSPRPRALKTGYTPPTFIINLSHQPSHRYDHVASALKPALSSINFDRLFTEAVSLILPQNVATSPRLAGFTATLLRRSRASSSGGFTAPRKPQSYAVLHAPRVWGWICWWR
jgi:hypothetical protein